MKSFISEVVAHLLAKHQNFDNLSFIFPSKRAGRFMIHHLNHVLDQTIFAPKIYSIEEFVEEVSELQSLDQTSIIFKLFEIYQTFTPKNEQESFSIFYEWAQTLVQDFNEIDRYCVDADSIFNYLSSVQDLNHWSKHDEKTELVANYLRFWHRLPIYYFHFKAKLISEKSAYPGLQYRTASEKIDSFFNGRSDQFIFVGFNALNKAEENIIQTALNSEKGEVFWDTDHVFFEDGHHGASFFLRRHAQWECFRSGKKTFRWINTNYQEQKEIEIFKIPKNIGQAKHIGTLLSKMPSENMETTAVVLGDEGLVLPVLNSLPDNIADVNITMGLPLDKTPLASLFDLLFEIHLVPQTTFYYKHVVEIINHPAMKTFLGKTTKKIMQTIHTDNRIYLHRKELLTMAEPQGQEVLRICFDKYQDNPLIFLKALELLSRKIKQQGDPIRNETLFHFNKLFKKLISLLEKHSPVKDLKTLYRIYQNSIRTESLDYSGSPFSGLQLMGLLETRSLDFETVIISSVNEGILPADSNASSFIPYDIKKEFGLPTHKEKDSIYSYHFYRLLQRAKKIILLYNSVPGQLNTGERSRFITQLLTEKQALHNITETTVSPMVTTTEKKLKTISKTPEIIQKTKKLASYGFSPSALITYIRNPLDFYHQYILGVKESEEVEETIATNTLGTVIHGALEKLYSPNIGTVLSKADMERMFEQYKAEVAEQFKEHYHTEELDSGKNLIIFEVAKRYVSNFLGQEKKLTAQNNIEIIALEEKIKIEIPNTGAEFPIFLKGSADRIDRFNDQIRIIDYKTGKVEQNDLKIDAWKEIIADHKYSKAFQVLCYAYMYSFEDTVGSCKAGIISFKNLSAGFLGFAEKNGTSTAGITSETLNLFEEQLKTLVLEICDPEIPFVEKEIETKK